MVSCGSARATGETIRPAIMGFAVAPWWFVGTITVINGMTFNSVLASARQKSSCDFPTVTTESRLTRPSAPLCFPFNSSSINNYAPTISRILLSDSSSPCWAVLLFINFCLTEARLVIVPLCCVKYYSCTRLSYYMVAIALWSSL